MGDGSRFGKLPADFLLDNNNLARLKTASECKVYMALCLHVDRNGECFPSYETITRKTGLSKSTVVRSVDRLEAAGLIVVDRGNEKGKRRFNVYQIVGLNGVTAMTPKAQEGAAPNGVISDPEWCHSGPRMVSSENRNGVTAMTPQQRVREQKEQTEQRAVAAAGESRSRPDTQYREAWKELVHGGIHHKTADTILESVPTSQVLYWIDAIEFVNTPRKFWGFNYDHVEPEDAAKVNGRPRGASLEKLVKLTPKGSRPASAA